MSASIRIVFVNLCVFVSLWWAVPSAAGENVAQQVLQMTGARTKIVWSRSGPPVKAGDSRANFAIIALDTNEGQERVLAAESFCRQPFITPSGKRVILDDFETTDKRMFSEKRSMYVVDWSGKNKRELCSVHYAIGVAEDPPGVEWAYYLDNQPGGKLWRVQIDDPKVKELVWDKTAAGHLWAFTRDGKTACTDLPWPDVDIASLPNGSYQRVCAGGCLMGIGPDGKHFLHCSNFGGDHHSIEVHTAPGAPGKAINCSLTAPGCAGSSLMFPSWALYDLRFFVISGPQPGTGPNKAAPCNILLGQFNDKFDGVAKWIQVSHCPEGYHDIIASAWIQSGPELKASPTAGLNVKLLDAYVKRMDKAPKLKPILDEIKKKVETSKNADEGKEAETIAAHIENWGKRQLESAQGMEGDSPKDAEAAYKDLAARLDGMETGAAAKKRLDEPDFQDGVRAWPNLERMQKVEKTLVDVPGAERSAKDEKFAAKNRMRLDEIRAAALSIQRQNPHAYLIPAVNELLEKLKFDPIGVPRAALPLAARAETSAGGDSWPADRKELIFLWENRKASFLAFDPTGKAVPSLTLAPRDLARFDHYYGLWCENGAFPVPNVEKFLLAQKNSNFTIEAYVTPVPLPAGKGGLGEIISFSAKSDDANFVLGQLGDKLVMTLKTAQTPNQPPVELCALAPNEPAHVVVTYAPGSLICYKNGKLATMDNHFQGALTNWTEQHLLFGANWDGQHPWSGHLEGVALFTRTLSQQDAQQEYAAFAEKLKARKPVLKIEVQAKLLAKSKTPKYEEVAPYTQAIAVYEYEIERVLSGQCKEKKIRVAHHAMLDRKSLPVSQAEVGKSYTLALEPFDSNPQLGTDYLSDELPVDTNISQFYDVGPLKK